MKAPPRRYTVCVLFFAAARRAGLSERSQWSGTAELLGVNRRMPEIVAEYRIAASDSATAVRRAIARAKAEGVARRAHLY